MNKAEDLIEWSLDFAKGLPEPVKPSVIRRLPDVKGRFLDADEENDKLKNKHGVYIFSREIDDEILYIGKADKCSLLVRVWSHLQTPSKDRGDISTDRFNIRIYPNHRWDGVYEAIYDIEYGNFVIKSLEIETPSVTSLIEVAMQLYCENACGLPSINRRIG